MIPVVVLFVPCRSAFSPGSVVKVEVKNFMTYAHCVIEPGPTLNLVLGPNGTGKSSFVCALCVGLGGSTKLLGRADDVKSFVRRGTDRGEVAVTLAKGDGRLVTIKRTLRADKNTTDFMIDGRNAQLQAVKKIVKEFNIQLDNLCQFLPQDKVNEFARMKPVELLRGTEAAIGDGELAEIHNSLIAEKKELDEKSRIVNVTTMALERLEVEFQDVERLVAPIIEKKKLEEEISVIEKKSLWAEYEELKEACKEDEKKMTQAKNTLARMQAELEKSNGPVKKKRAEKEKVKESLKSVAAQRKRVGMDSEVAKSSKHIESMKKIHDAIASLESDAKFRKEKIEKLQGEISHLEYQKAKLDSTSVEEKKHEINTLRNQSKDIANQKVSVQNTIDTYMRQKAVFEDAARRYQGELGKLQDAKIQRLRNLAARNPDIVGQYEYVRQNRSRFRGKIWGPLATEIDIQDPTYASMLEQQLPFEWMSYFIVEYDSDMELLRNELISRGHTPNISFYGGDTTAPLSRPAGQASDFAHCGVVQSLDETFQAPPIIKHALNDQFFLSSIFVMNSVNSDWESVFNACPKCETIWTNEYQIRRRVSRYNPQNSVTSLNNLSKGIILTPGSAQGNEEEKQRLEMEMRENSRQAQEFHEKAEALRPEEKSLEAEKTANLQRQTELRNEIERMNGQAKSINVKLEAMRKHLQTHMNSPDPRGNRPALEEKLSESLDDVISNALKIPGMFKKYSTCLREESALELKAVELEEQISILGETEEQKRTEYNNMRSLVDELSHLLGEHHRKIEDAKMKAEEATGFPIDEELEAQFALLPASKHELQDLADDKKARLESIVIGDPGAQARYERISRNIENSRQQLRDCQEAKAQNTAKVEELKNAWLPEIRRLVDKINGNFSEAFATVGIAGEVVLNEADEEDFSKYAIDLRVKFRESAQLMTLDSAYHSGGESSTSTILYLMALQGVTTSPFRVVDEINQGMDSINERSVFKLLVDAATEPDTPQCFLLTPKLLPDLPFAKEVTVLQIMNGVHIKDVATGFAASKIAGKARLDHLDTRQPIQAT